MQRHGAGLALRADLQRGSHRPAKLQRGEIGLSILEHDHLAVQRCSAGCLARKATPDGVQPPRFGKDRSWPVGIPLGAFRSTFRDSDRRTWTGEPRRRQDGVGRGSHRKHTETKQFPCIDERRGRDSNSRMPFGISGLQDRCNRPLCHPSRTAGIAWKPRLFRRFRIVRYPPPVVHQSPLKSPPGH